MRALFNKVAIRGNNAIWGEAMTSSSPRGRSVRAAPSCRPKAPTPTNWEKLADLVCKAFDARQLTLTFLPGRAKARGQWIARALPHFRDAPMLVAKRLGMGQAYSEELVRLVENMPIAQGQGRTIEEAIGAMKSKI